MGACNLGSIHLHRFVINPFEKNASINYELLRDVIRTSVKLLDGIIDKNVFPNIAYENYQKNLRTIGLGITGLDNVFSMLGMEYGSVESQEFTENIMQEIMITAYGASIDLAVSNGDFPMLEREKFIESGFLKRHAENKKYGERWENIRNLIIKHGIRNARIGSIAPVGTMSLTFGDNCSSGIEPCFMNEVNRTVKVGGQTDDHKQVIKVRDFAYSKFFEKYKGQREYKHKTALELDVDNHLDILSIVAKHTDMSVSKTINIPTEYSFEDTKEVYMKAWKRGIKGCTIFRPNELRQGIFNVKDEKETTNTSDLPWGTTIESSDDLFGRKRKIMTGCGSLHVQAWFDKIDGKLIEVYLSKGSEGGCNSFMNGLSRMMSGALRTGMSLEYALDQLRSAPACPSYVGRTMSKKDTSRGKSCPDAIANALLEMQKEILLEIEDNDDIVYKSDNIESVNGKSKTFCDNVELDECPECGKKTVSPLGGCLTCHNCGWSKCG